MTTEHGSGEPKSFRVKASYLEALWFQGPIYPQRNEYKLEKPTVTVKIILQRDRWTVSLQLQYYKDFHNKSTVFELQSDVDDVIRWVFWLTSLFMGFILLHFDFYYCHYSSSGYNYEKGDWLIFLISNKLHSTCWIFNLHEESILKKY